MKLVRARLRYRVNPGARVHARTGGYRTGLNLELLKRVWKRYRKIVLTIRIDMYRTIEDVQRTTRSSSGDIDIHRSLHSSMRCRHVGRNGCSRDKDQIRCITAVQRQLHNAFVFDDLTDPHGTRLYESGI